jgi:predicted nucleic acid-binding protein
VDPIDFSGLPAGGLVLIDSAPIIYVLEQHAAFAPRFLPLFKRQAAGEVSFAVTTISIVEVLSGPLRNGDEALAKRCRIAMESWQVIELNVEIAESAARLRAGLKLKLADAIQAASAIAVDADALVTHDRDFSRLKGLTVLS